MKIHLTRTPEYPIKHFQEVVELLQAFGGEMEFVDAKFEYSKDNFRHLKWNLYPYHPFKYPSNTDLVKFNPDYDYPLSWIELFSMCSGYRKICNVPNEDFVVLLTHRKNALNWFSAFDNRNIFVHSAEWELFTKCHHKFPVAYEIIANILQSLMKLDIHNANEFLHEFPWGCINDFCQNKKQVILKLRTGDICGDCLEKMQKENINTAIISQALTIFEGIRKQMLFKQGFQQNIKISRLLVTPEYRIFLPDFGNIEIKLSARQKSIYFLFLKHNEGIRLKELSDYKDELWFFYQNISKAEDLQNMKKTIEVLFSSDSSALNEELSRIKSEFKKKIGNINPTLLDTYCIIGERDEKKKMSLDRQLVSLPF